MVYSKKISKRRKMSSKVRKTKRKSQRHVKSRRRSRKMSGGISTIYSYNQRGGGDERDKEELSVKLDRLISEVRQKIYGKSPTTTDVSDTQTVPVAPIAPIVPQLGGSISRYFNLR